MATLTLLLIVPSAASAQWLRGRVIDDASGLPIRGAVLELLTDGGRMAATVMSDERGYFFMKAPRSDIYRLQAGALGYATATGHPITLLAADTMQVEFRLAVQAVLLAPITVQSRRFAQVPYNLIPFYERRLTYGRLGLGRFFDSSQVREFNGLPITSLLQQKGGVRFEPSGTQDWVMVGRNNCPLAVFIDGVEHRDIQTARDLEIAVTTSAVGAVEVYANTMPAEFTTLTEVAVFRPGMTTTLTALGTDEDGGGLQISSERASLIYRACGAIALWSR